MRALLVHNPAAGTKGHDRDSITDALHLADIKVDYVSTKDAHLQRALRRFIPSWPAGAYSDCSTIAAALSSAKRWARRASASSS